MKAPSQKPYILYGASPSLSDLYKHIDNGHHHFYCDGFIDERLDRKSFDFLFCLAPELYYKLPIVEVISYFLDKTLGITVSEMSLTALHEAMSNSLLWGLLKVERTEDFFEFSKCVEKKLKLAQRAHKTFSLGITCKKGLKFHIINPHDEAFTLEIFNEKKSPYLRGSTIIGEFANVDYDTQKKMLTLTFNEHSDVYKATAHS
jgi:hypothetical protein